MSRYDEEPRRSWPEEPPRRPPRPPGRIWLTVVVSGLVAAVVTVALNFVLVPSGVGWRRLVHEGTVTVPGGKPFTVTYPSSFAKPPTLTLEAQGNDTWYFSIDEQTSDHFTVTNTTIRRDSGTPVMLILKWKAEGARW